MRPAWLLGGGLALLALAGCPSRLGIETRGGDECPGGVCEVPKAAPRVERTYHVRVVSRSLPVEAGWDPVGMTYSWVVLGRTTPHTVALDPELSPYRDWCRMVAVHEFGHVIGLPHFRGDAGWMGPTSGVGDPLLEGPSPAELLRAQETSRGVQIVLRMDAAMPLTMREAAAWAAGAWAAGSWVVYSPSVALGIATLSDSAVDTAELDDEPL